MFSAALLQRFNKATHPALLDFGIAASAPGLTGCAWKI
jgi:hypothetical protein